MNKLDEAVVNDSLELGIKFKEELGALLMKYAKRASSSPETDVGGAVVMAVELVAAAAFVSHHVLDEEKFLGMVKENYKGVTAFVDNVIAEAEEAEGENEINLWKKGK